MTKMENSKKDSKFISLVIYLHNAHGEIVPFLEKTIPTFERQFSEFEIIFVNDGCTDGTIEELREYLENSDAPAMINIVHMSFFHGCESAMNAGRDIAIGDFVYEFDTLDVDYQSELLLQVYEKLMEGSDIVAAAPRNGTRLTSKFFYTLYNMTSRSRGGKIRTETFRIVSRRAINRVKSMGQYIPYRKAVYANCGLHTDVILYDTMGKKKEKKYVRERFSLALDSFIYFTNVLETVSLIGCVFFLILTVGVGIYIARDFFSNNPVAEGWMSTMGFMALGFFGIFVLLTIILKYLSVILNLIFKKQNYLISDIEKVVKE